MARVGDFVQVYSGRAFYPMDPRVEDITIEDIAHSLSMRCRFGGHCTRFYSVAEHSVLVSDYVEPQHALWGLLHDAAEAYSCDVPHPLKRMLPQWVPMERKIMDAVCEAFGLDPVEPDNVVYTDWALLHDEKIALINPSYESWGDLPPPLGAKIVGYEPEVAKNMFLDRFYELAA